LQRALAIREKTLGPEHPAVASILSSLGMLDYLRHNYSEAESRYKRAISAWNKASQAQTLNYAQTLQNLGVLYFDLQKYDEAGALFDRAATIKEHLLGKDDPDVADALIKVACSTLARGYYAEAESPSQRALSILEKSSPPNYTALIQALTNYAVVLEKTKRKAEAELLETRAMVYRAKLKNSKSKGEAVLSAKQP
jgi:tetratricopeptide (TPR) repeat protein